MTIAMDKYVKITSGVGGNNAVRRRDLILRIFSESPKLSPDAVLEFSSDTAVADYFGAGSPEAGRATRYFSYISPNISRPQKISFARDQSAASPPITMGLDNQFSLDVLKTATGVVTFVTGGVTLVTASVSFAAITSFGDAAGLLQAALRAAPNATPTILTATVEYDPTGPNFVVTGGTNAAVKIEFQPDNQGVADLMGLTGGSEAVQGVERAIPVEQSVAAADDISNNYGTFITTRQLTLPQAIAVAQFNGNKNVQFEYVIGVTRANADSWSAALIDIASVTLVLVANVNVEFDEVLSAAFKAATDYSRQNSVISYMYRQSPGVTPKVTKTDDSNALDKLRVNYYGQTQTAGQFINFYQRGVMMGTATAPVDQNVHANEQWLKDDISAGFLQLLITLGRVSANALGANKIINVIASTVARATSNGSISIDKPLTDLQKLYIGEQSGDPNAYIQVQNIGYWYSCVMEPYTTEDGRTEWQAVYTLIYSKDDTIRRVEGRHILI